VQRTQLGAVRTTRHQRASPYAYLGIEPKQLVDAWHVLEYVATAARLLEARGKCAPGTFRRWKAMLLEGAEGKGARDELQALEGTGTRKVRDAEGRQPVNDAIRYLENRSSRMDYAGARAHGLPLGSGAVEATCKSLVAIRRLRAASGAHSSILGSRREWAPACQSFAAPLEGFSRLARRLDPRGRTARASEPTASSRTLPPRCSAPAPPHSR